MFLVQKRVYLKFSLVCVSEEIRCEAVKLGHLSNRVCISSEINGASVELGLYGYNCRMYYNFFIHSSVFRHLGCFQLLAIKNSATVSIGVQLTVLNCVLGPIRYIPRGRIAES